MKRYLFIMLFAAATILLSNAYVMAQIKPRMAGIGLRGSYWDMNTNSTLVSIVDQHRHVMVDVGGAGGWLNFFSRTSDNWFMEFSLGAVTRVVDEVENVAGKDTRVKAVVPVLIGMRYHVLSPNHRGAIRPYLSFGAGPYWIADIFVQDQYYKEEVTVDSELKPGGYAGVGLDFMMTDWFGLNFDARRHFVNFNTNAEHSGYEYALGIQFMWGNYRPGRNR